MRRVFLISLSTLFFLAACSDVKRPNDANFKKAIDQYLAKRGKACTWIGHPFPIDIPVSGLKEQYGIVPQMAALERPGLVHSSDAVAATAGMLGPGLVRPVKRYELTDEGKKYFQLTPGVFGQVAGFCYGEKTVDSVIKWTEPVTTGPLSQTQVTYTYKITGLAPWAERPDVQGAFSDLRQTISGVSKSNETTVLQLTNQGWEVPGQ